MLKPQHLVKKANNFYHLVDNRKYFDFSYDVCMKEKLRQRIQRCLPISVYIKFLEAGGTTITQQIENFQTLSTFAAELNTTD